MGIHLAEGGLFLLILLIVWRKAGGVAALGLFLVVALFVSGGGILGSIGSAERGLLSGATDALNSVGGTVR
jgi:hypothetical protein